MQKQNFFDRFKAKYGLSSNFQVFIIFVVFAITGSSAVRLASPILEFLGITKAMAPYVYWPLRILIIFPIYQILLITFGTLFGQFRFFWNMEKKMLGRFIGKKY